MPYRVTIDLFPGGLPDREPVSQEFDTFTQADHEFQGATEGFIPPYEITIWEREDGTLHMDLVKRLTVMKEG